MIHRQTCKSPAACDCAAGRRPPSGRAIRLDDADGRAHWVDAKVRLGRARVKPLVEDLDGNRFRPA